MELKLVVLAGAKQGTQIPLKKDKFIIGRASECTLRAGSDAISRRHCAILRTKETWVARDLGSRNGTYLNDQRIESPQQLSVGDELRVGPLKFRVEQYTKPAADAESAKAGKATESDLPPDIKRSKQPPVKNIAEVAQREANKQNDSAEEDDISRWLLGTLDPSGPEAMRDTKSLSMEDTTTIVRAAPSEQNIVADDAEDLAVVEEEELGDATSHESADEKADTGSSRWKFLRRGKKAGEKKKPGKLPERPDQSAKDSREAAADILRGMTRRR